MTYKVDELVLLDGAWVQQTRDATPEESAEIDSRKVAPPPVPQSISPRQFRQALTHYGFRSAVEDAVASANQDTKDWYEYATSFERAHPVVTAMAQGLGYTSDQMDEVWTYGAGL